MLAWVGRVSEIRSLLDDESSPRRRYRGEINIDPVKCRWIVRAWSTRSRESTVGK